jgi:hypothetical protein
VHAHTERCVLGRVRSDTTTDGRAITTYPRFGLAVVLTQRIVLISVALTPAVAGKPQAGAYPLTHTQMHPHTDALTKREREKREYPEGGGPKWVGSECMSACNMVCT